MLCKVPAIHRPIDNKLTNKLFHQSMAEGHQKYFYPTLYLKSQAGQLLERNIIYHKTQYKNIKHTEFLKRAEVPAAYDCVACMLYLNPILNYFVSC